MLNLKIKKFSKKNMKNLILIISVLAISIGCEKKTDTSINSENKNEDSVASLENLKPIESSTDQSCYIGVTGKDSVFISLDDNLGTFTGKMHYKNFEKDSSNGDLIGTKNGDTLKLNFTFAAEGTTSEREIYFLMKDDQLTEAIGDHKMENNKDFYANTSKLKYTGQVLKKTDFKNFEKNFTSK